MTLKSFIRSQVAVDPSDINRFSTVHIPWHFSVLDFGNPWLFWLIFPQTQYHSMFIIDFDSVIIRQDNILAALLNIHVFHCLRHLLVFLFIEFWVLQKLILPIMRLFLSVDYANINVSDNFLCSQFGVNDALDPGLKVFRQLQGQGNRSWHACELRKFTEFIIELKRPLHQIVCM